MIFRSAYWPPPLPQPPCAGDVKEPERTIPRATAIGTILTAVIYILSTVAVMGALPRLQLQTSGAPFAAYRTPPRGSAQTWMKARSSGRSV